MFGFRHGFGDPGERERGFGGPGHHFFFGDKLGSAAEYLGLSEDELHEQLRDGKSLAEVAEAEGKSVDGLKQAILAGAKSGLDEAVAAERLTQEQADAIYERLQGVIDDLVNGTLRGPGGGALRRRSGLAPPTTAAATTAAPAAAPPTPPSTGTPRRKPRRPPLSSGEEARSAGLFHISTPVRGSHARCQAPGRGRRGRSPRRGERFRPRG